MDIILYFCDNAKNYFKFRFTELDFEKIKRREYKFYLIKCFSAENTDNTSNLFSSDYFELIKIENFNSRYTKNQENNFIGIHLQFEYKLNKLYKLDFGIGFYPDRTFRVFQSVLSHTKLKTPKEFHDIRFINLIRNELSTIFNNLINITKNKNYCYDCKYKFQYNLEPRCPFIYEKLNIIS